MRYKLLDICIYWKQILHRSHRSQDHYASNSFLVNNKLRWKNDSYIVLISKSVYATEWLLLSLLKLASVRNPLSRWWPNSLFLCRLNTPVISPVPSTTLDYSRKCNNLTQLEKKMMILLLSLSLNLGGNGEKRWCSFLSSKYSLFVMSHKYVMTLHNLSIYRECV